MLRAKLEAFHNRCVRAMCGVTRTHVRSLSGGHEALRQRLGIPSMQLLISTRKLRWAGHVVRMDAERLPRKFFSSWIKGVTRPRGRCMSYGHDLARELRAVGFNLDKRAQAIGVSSDWVAVAQDRADVWRRVVAEGSCSCLDSEGGTPSGVAPPCMSVSVSSCYETELSVTEVSMQQMRIPSAPVKAHWLLTSSHRAPAGPEGSGPDPVGGVTLRLRLRLRLTY